MAPFSLHLSPLHKSTSEATHVILFSSCCVSWILSSSIFPFAQQRGDAAHWSGLAYALRCSPHVTAAGLPLPRPRHGRRDGDPWQPHLRGSERTAHDVFDTMPNCTKQQHRGIMMECCFQGSGNRVVSSRGTSAGYSSPPQKSTTEHHFVHWILGWVLNFCYDAYSSRGFWDQTEGRTLSYR